MNGLPSGAEGLSEAATDRMLLATYYINRFHEGSPSERNAAGKCVIEICLGLLGATDAETNCMRKRLAFGFHHELTNCLRVMSRQEMRLLGRDFAAMYQPLGARLRTLLHDDHECHIGPNDLEGALLSMDEAVSERGQYHRRLSEIAAWRLAGFPDRIEEWVL